VAASLAAWHDKVECSVRQLERQVAALRLGGTLLATNEDGSKLSSISGLSMSDEEVSKYYRAYDFILTGALIYMRNCAIVFVDIFDICVIMFVIDR
jgi:hypothetical protein